MEDNIKKEQGFKRNVIVIINPRGEPMNTNTVLKLKIFKAAAGAVNGVFNKLVYNRDMPEVGNHIKDLAYGENVKHKLDVVIPKCQGPYPIVVYIHGGGWCIGDKKSYTRICKVMAHKGYLVFNINYRLSPEHNYPSQLKDVASAISFIYSIAHKYNGDCSRFFLAGDSAGAHLSSWYAAALNSSSMFESAGISGVIPRESLKGLLLFYGAYDLEKAVKSGFGYGIFDARMMLEGFMGDSLEKCRDMVYQASPLNFINEAFPPSFVCSSEKDRLHGESVRLIDKMADLGIEHEQLIYTLDKYPQLEHGFISIAWEQCSKDALDKAICFMDKHI
ncbi:MAG: alpha/beta hydrolase [Bacillota bacterium]